MIALGGAVAAVLGLVVFLLVTGGDGEDDEKGEEESAGASLLTEGFEYGPKKQSIGNLATIFDAEPCNKTVAIDLANELNVVGDHRGALRVVNAYDASCEPVRKLWWKEMYAREQLGEWVKAAEVGDRLVRARPSDSDYWWWRGKARARLDQPKAAAADFRQSLAMRPNKFAAQRLHQIDECEGAFALLRYYDREPRATWAEQRALMSLGTEGCDALRGRGNAELTAETEALIGDVPLRARFDIHAGTTALSRAAADRLGLEVTGDPVSVWVDGTMTLGTPIEASSIKLGEAGAIRVPVVVVDALEGDRDLVIGQSLLWRFEVALDGDAILLYELPSA